MSITAVPLHPVKRSHLVYLWVGIACALLLAAALAWAAPVDPGASVLSSNARKPGVVVTKSGVQYKVLTPGQKGASPGDTDLALVLYEGKLANGQTFDASAQPTPLPVNGVVPGFSEGLKLMHKGEKLRLWIPPALGYGKEEKRDPNGKVAIPANSVLVFDVQLLDFKSEEEVRRIQMQMQQQQMMGGGMPGGPAGLPVGPGGLPGAPEAAPH